MMVVMNMKPRRVLIVVSIIFVWKATHHTHALTTLPILFQNEHIAVVSKPPLVPCHVPQFRDKKNPKARRRSSTSTSRKDRTPRHDDIIDTVHQRAIETFSDKEKIYLVHRLDAPTSGCLLLAFHSDAARELGKALSSSSTNTTTKTYYALCRGDGEALRQRGETFVTDGDIKDAKGILRSAETELQGLWGSPSSPRRCCLVRARPKTGRWHQIRQHLARENYPIVGETRHHPDRKENKAWREILKSSQNNITQRLCLHCHRIQIAPPLHPGTNDDAASYHQFLPPNGLDVSCPLPEDMRKIIDMTDWANEAHDALPELFDEQQPHPTVQ
jgi:23S rRNA-/tRNA-specific pseudouridylate synthase